MRIGNWLGWLGDLGAGRRPGCDRRRAGRGTSHDGSPGGALDRPVWRSLFRRLRPDPIRRRTDHQDDRRQGRRAQGTERAGTDRTDRKSVSISRDGIPSRSWARTSPTESRPRSFRSRRASRSPGTSITGRPRPTRSTNPGPAATGGSIPMSMCTGDDDLDRTPGQLYRSWSGHRAGRPQRPARDAAASPAMTPPGSPTSTTI